MDWKLLSKDGDLLEKVNCEYDAIDIAKMMYDAKTLELDFDKQEARIKEYQDDVSRFR